MKKRFLLLTALIMLLSVKSFALEDIEVGLRLGADVAINTIGFYTDSGKYIPKRCDFDGRFASIGFAGAVYADFAFSDNIILGVTGNFSLFRGYNLIQKDSNDQEIGSTKVTFHTFALDIMFKSRYSFDERFGMFGGIGLGPTFNTKPNYKASIHGNTTQGQVENAKLYVGLNLIAEFGLSIQTVENQFFTFGARTSLDVLAYSYNKGIPSAEIKQQSAISPYNIGVFVGYSFRF